MAAFSPPVLWLFWGGPLTNEHYLIFCAFPPVVHRRRFPGASPPPSPLPTSPLRPSPTDEAPLAAGSDSRQHPIPTSRISPRPSGALPLRGGPACVHCLKLLSAPRGRAPARPRQSHAVPGITPKPGTSAHSSPGAHILALRRTSELFFSPGGNRAGRGRLARRTLVSDISEKQRAKKAKKKTKKEQKKEDFPRGRGLRAPRHLKVGRRRPASTRRAAWSGPSTCPTSGGTEGRYTPGMHLRLGTRV